MLSLTGIPPTVGFWGKFYLFTAVVNAQLTWLADRGRDHERGVGVLLPARGLVHVLPRGRRRRRGRAGRADGHAAARASGRGPGRASAAGVLVVGLTRRRCCGRPRAPCTWCSASAALRTRCRASGTSRRISGTLRRRVYAGDVSVMNILFVGDVFGRPGPRRSAALAARLSRRARRRLRHRQRRERRQRRRHHLQDRPPPAGRRRGRDHHRQPHLAAARGVRLPGDRRPHRAAGQLPAARPAAG